MPRISAIVPAAGSSSRMGGPNKLLLPYGEGTVVGAVVQTLLACDLDVVVVTGRDALEVASAVSPAATVFNPRHEEGLGTSIACGVAARPDADGYLIALGDMPGLTSETVRALLAAFDSDAIVVPTLGMPPVLFGRVFRDDLLSLKGDRGARSILNSHSEAVWRVDVATSTHDIDTVNDYGRATQSSP